MSNSHIYKFSQNNLYSYNIIADSMERDSYFRKCKAVEIGKKGGCPKIPPWY
jgi:hypothetical protein